MQPETVREVQTHLLSSVSSNFAILQSLQGRNEGSTVHIPDGSCMRKRVCSVQQTPHSPISGLRCLLCPSIPFLHPERWQPLSPWLLIPLLLATYCHVPTVCPTVSFSKSLVALCKHSSVSLQNLSFSIFLVLYKKKKKKALSSLGRDWASGMPWPKSLLSFGLITSQTENVSACLLSFVFPLADQW